MRFSALGLISSGTRVFAALLALTVGHIATAAPVNIYSDHSFDHFWVLQNGPTGVPGNFRALNYTCLASCPEEFGYADQQQTASGSTYARVFGSVTESVSTTDSSVTWNSTQLLEAYARVDSTVTGGRAVAQAIGSRYSFQLEVLEPVLFTGTHSLGSGFNQFASGSILNPGSYHFFISPFSRTVEATAYAGDESLVSSTQHVQYNFVAVPAPATAPLLLLGLATIGWVRRGKRSKF